MPKRRIFIAVNIPEVLRKKLFGLKNRWPDLPCRWIKPENLHLTIIPPIYLTDDELARMSTAVGESIADFPSFELGFDKIIYGPPGRPGRMIWLLGKPNEKLTELKNVISKAILDANIPYREELRPLTPHVTLCRMVEEKWRKFEPKPKIEEAFSHRYIVNKIEIMESELKRGGAEYITIEKVSLAS